MNDFPIRPQITLTEPEIQLLIDRAAEAGARKALHDIGLHDENAHADVKELRGLLDSWRDAKRTAFKTTVSWATKGFLILLLIGGWMELKDKP